MWLWNRQQHQIPEWTKAGVELGRAGGSVGLPPTKTPESQEAPRGPSSIPPPQSGIESESPAPKLPLGTDVQTSPQPPDTATLPAVTALPVPTQHRSPVAGGGLPATGVSKAPIAARLQMAANSLQMLLGAPDDEQLPALRQASSSRAEVKVQVVAPHGEATSLGRARVTEVRDVSGRNTTFLLEFIEMPEMGALVKLTNARLSSEARLVIALEQGHEVEYPFSMGAGELGETR